MEPSRIVINFYFNAIFFLNKLNKTEYSEKISIISGITAILYFVALLMMSSLANFDAIDLRLMAPFFMAILLTGFFLLPTLIERKKYTLFLICVFLISSVVIKGLQKEIVIHADWESRNFPSIQLNSDAYYNNFTNHEPKGLLADIIEKMPIRPKLLISERPQVFEYLTGISAIEIPPGKIDSSWIQKMRNYDQAFLILQRRAREMVDFAKQQGLDVRYNQDFAKIGTMVIDLSDPYVK